MVLPILTIFVGALGLAAGLQELVVQGILGNQLIPLTGGTLGAVAAGLLLAAGIALLRRTPRATALARAAACAALPVAVLIGMPVLGLAGWPMTLLGIAWPLVLLVWVKA